MIRMCFLEENKMEMYNLSAKIETCNGCGLLLLSLWWKW